MRRGADVVRTARTEVDGDLSKLRNVVDDLVAAWKGQASMGFTNVMEEWDRNATKLVTAMDRIADLLETSGQEFTVTDEDQQRLVERTRDYSGALGQRL
jgi:WXG100 family type VII secretion target